MAGEQLRQTVKQGEQLLASLQVKHLPILHYDSKVCLALGTQGLNLDILFQQLILISFLKRGGLNDFLPRMEWTNNELTKSDNSKINYWDLISFLTGISDRQAAPKYNIIYPANANGLSLRHNYISTEDTFLCLLTEKTV